MWFSCHNSLNTDIDDYVEIVNDSNPLVPFTSDPSTHKQCFGITILDDYALEDTEDFFLSLFLAENSSVPVVVDPPISEVDIVDDDRKQFTILC